MEIRLLQYVMAVYECQSFTRAAQHLHVAQPSLSQQIAKLERTLGLQLFHRGPGPITATQMGRYFVERAQRILDLHDDLLLDLEERTHGMGHELVIGTTAITGAHVLPKLLREFQTSHPLVRPHLVEESTTVLTQWVADGKLDLAVLSLPIEMEGIDIRHLLTEPLWLAIPSTVQPWMASEARNIIEALAKHKPSDLDKTSEVSKYMTFQTGLPSGPAKLSLRAVSEAPFVLLKEGYGFRKTVMQLCADDGFQPQIAFETSSIDTAQALVANGMGVTLVPHMVRLSAGSTGLASPLYVGLEAGSTRTLVFAFPKDRHLKLAARVFMDLAALLPHDAGVNAPPQGI